ncbi:ABC transporter permease [Olsenella massiliensis]|uniref:ABC transporter permease n=1 Tax=Olsenella massiliensis TaxID=1622075 RepID=UPI0009E73DB8|nr:ABC transporter permease [Olsenella massiliensis]
MRNLNLSRLSKPIILVAFVVTLAILRPSSFLTISNFANVLWSVSVIGIMVCGTIFVFLLGGIDLSIGTLAGLSAVTVVEVIKNMGATNESVIIGVLAALGVGAAAGVVHGLIITKFDIPAFLVTFASQMVFLGLSMVITNNQIVSAREPVLFTAIGSMKVLGFPLPIYLMLLIAVGSWFVLSKTTFGRGIYAIGGNPVASEISGIQVKRSTVLCYVFSGVTAAIGGIVLAAMTQQGMASTGTGYETQVITAGVIGGVSLLGGVGTVSGCIYGAVLMGLINNALNLLSVPSTQSGLVQGLVIIVAVAFDALQHQDQSRRKARRILGRLGGDKANESPAA